ncbi:putative allantoate deiminase isoform X1 [Canna indica]|uniref:Allantoate deiminase isoform X1 n=1 Tax=Canna indica TaxID=4628 RepID=A0AAQ3L234_9LILI|nr:putative allantoate deiminase isoform X1 [Canna indica]
MALFSGKSSPFYPAAGKNVPISFLVIALMLVIVAGSLEGLEEQSIGDGGNEWLTEILRDEAVERLDQLAKISDADGYIERTFLSPASRRASVLIIKWMQDAGLRTWVDQMGNVHGRIEGINTTAEALLIGSHFDTVVDAGKFDGTLGIICAISALKALKINGKLHKLSRPVEVIAFSDEEGVRFQSTFLGSAAIAGQLPASALRTSDKNGVTIQDVLKESSFEGNDASVLQVKYDPESVWGYIEVHIEQGPVLESLGYPLGIVQGIAGQTRLKVKVSGSQGHAGTVPMLMRQDSMTAAAELIVNLESLCKYPDKLLTYNEECAYYKKESFAGLVCTVGEISSWPGASNVIPGQESSITHQL